MEVNKVQITDNNQNSLSNAMDKHRRTAKQISALNKRLDVAKKLSDSTLGNLGLQDNIIG